MVKLSLPAQFRDLFKPARYKAFYGGRGSAKSHSFATGLAEQVPLHVTAPVGVQELHLLEGFDAFGDRREPASPCHGDQSRGDRRIGLIGGDVADELAVDLELVDGQVLQTS